MRTRWVDGDNTCYISFGEWLSCVVRQTVVVSSGHTHDERSVMLYDERHMKQHCDKFLANLGSRVLDLM